jgi:hypothetical protein
MNVSSDRKLHAISQWLDGRSDSTIYDYIYRVNAGKFCLISSKMSQYLDLFRMYMYLTEEMLLAGAGLNLFEGDITGFHRHHRHSVRILYIITSKKFINLKFY